MARPVSLEALAAILGERGHSGRSMTALAGPPGAGKSTLAAVLAARLNSAAPGSAAILEMDGYHFDDAVLEESGLQARKGAPETFDVAGLRAMLERLKRNVESEIAVPVFDRDLEIARGAARIIPRPVRHVIVEGNYLLLERPPWSELKELFDTTVMIAVPEAVLRQRLAARWQGCGLSPREIAAKLDDNDLPNGRVVMEESVAAEFVLAGEAEEED